MVLKGRGGLTQSEGEASMNTSRLVGGIICLALAVLLAVLYFRLPAGQVTFMIGDTNMPLVPVIILGVIGIALLATVRSGAREPAPERQPIAIDEGKAALNKRLETMAWGCFLIMVGGFVFVPRDIVDKGLWSIGIGVIMLGLNATRYVYHIKLSGFTTVLGIISLVGGVAELRGMRSLEGPVLLIILGAYLLVKPWFEKRRVFGKAEEA
jgi:hypothetical protein